MSKHSIGHFRCADLRAAASLDVDVRRALAVRIDRYGHEPL